MGSNPARKGVRYAGLCAAYIKFNDVVLSNTKSLNLKNLDSILEVNIPKDISLLNQQIFIDVISSDAKSEYYSECKFSESINEIGVKSKEFMDAILEFVCLKKYIKENYRKEIGYLFFTTYKINRLKEERNNLVNLEPSKYNDYMKILEDYRAIKWPNSIKIDDINYVKNVITNITIHQFELSMLEESLKNEKIKNYFDRIMSEYQDRNPHNDPFVALEQPDLFLDIKNGEGDIYFYKIKNYQYVVNKYALLEFKKYINKINVKKYKKLSFNNISPKISLSYNYEIPQYDLIKNISEIFNDFSKDVEKTFFIIIPNIMTVYVVNKKWFNNIIMKNMDKNNRYLIENILKMVNMNISIDLIKLMIIEYKRIEGIMLDTEYF